MQYAIGFPIQFQASLNFALARARNRFFKKASQLPKPFNFHPTREALEELLKERVKTSIADFGKLTCKAVKEGLWRLDLAAPGMKEFLKTISMEAYNDADHLYGGGFSYSFPDLEREVTTSPRWLGYLKRIAAGPTKKQGSVISQPSTVPAHGKQGQHREDQPEAPPIIGLPQNALRPPTQTTAAGAPNDDESAASQVDQPDALSPDPYRGHQQSESGESQLTLDTPPEGPVGESHATPPRKNTNPTDDQVIAAEAMVTSKPDIDTRHAAWYLRCSQQHVLRLVRAGKLKATKTSPKRITTSSLRGYKWPSEK